MKRIVASVGLVAVGASGVNAASVADMTTEGAKPWSVFASLRGFYDDNVGTAPKSSPGHVESIGWEVSPGLNLKWTGEQTTFNLGYIYSYLYYENPPPGQTGKTSQTHSFQALLDHSFNEQNKVKLQDSFVIGQEADFLRAGSTFATFQRVPGNNIRNYGGITYNAELSRLFGIELGYDNVYFHYQDSGTITNNLNQISPSFGGLLDRLENYLHLDGRWKLQPDTVGVIGYRYGQVNYIGDEIITQDLVTGAYYKSDVRNSRSQYGYLGVDHTFRPDLTGSLRAGARYTQYPNEPDNGTSLGPMLQGNLTYSYAPESSVQIGLNADLSATDIFSAENGSVTTSAQSATIFGTLTHRIMPKLYGSLTAQFQNSRFIGGTYNNESDRYFLAGLNVEYRFNQYLSTHVGYNYDKLGSDIPNRSFDRNRVYIGVTATY
jgi:hypothetical protein